MTRNLLELWTAARAAHPHNDTDPNPPFVRALQAFAAGVVSFERESRAQTLGRTQPPPLLCDWCGAPDEPASFTCGTCGNKMPHTVLRLSLRGFSPTAALDVLRAQEDGRDVLAVRSPS